MHPTCVARSAWIFLISMTTQKELHNFFPLACSSWHCQDAVVWDRENFQAINRLRYSMFHTQDVSKRNSSFIMCEWERGIRKLIYLTTGISCLLFTLPSLSNQHRPMTLVGTSCAPQQSAHWVQLMWCLAWWAWWYCSSPFSAWRISWEWGSVLQNI